MPSRWKFYAFLLFGFVISLQNCHAAVPLLARGGARWASSPTGFGNTGRSQQKQRFPIVQDLANDDSENQETKEMIDAFLTRDSRNTFIGKQHEIACYIF